MDGWKLVVWAICLIQVTFAQNPYFWHITDFHLDPSYGTSDASCNHQVENPGEYGDFECDAPYKLVEESIKAMMQLGNNPEFIIYTGDTPVHAKDYSNFDPNTIISYLRNATNLLKSSLPGKTVVMALGNHDYYPRNQHPGKNNGIYEATAGMMDQWLGTFDATNTFRRGAYYTRQLIPGGKIRIVVVNTNLYLHSNKETDGDPDPGDQYSWLDNVLANAQRNGEKVHLIGHVPPGVMPDSVAGGRKWLREADNTRFVKLIENYGDVIVGFYSSHEHFDTFRVFYNDNKPVTSMLVAPSVTPWRDRLKDNKFGQAHNPGLRKIYYDPIQGHLTDIEQFYMDLNKANAGNAKWEKLYSFKETYGVADLTAASLHELAQELKTDSGKSDKYIKYNSVDASHPSVAACGCNCMKLHSCSFTNLEYSEFDTCIEADPCPMSNYFWHITDLHLDDSYGTTGESCNTDVVNPGQYGDFECDAPFKLIESTIMAMKSHGNEPAFVVYTGDSPQHPKDYGTFNEQVVIGYLQTVTDLFKKHLPDTQFVIALGNHDYYPRNQQPGEGNAIYTSLADMMGEWLGGQEAVDTFKKGAYYTRMMVPEKKIRVVVLNTNLYLSSNDVTKGMEDPGDQYAWLEEVLTSAQQGGEHVHMLTHVPPGVKPDGVAGARKWMREEDNVKLNDIVNKYGDVIVGFYSCHEHFDTFRVFYENDEPKASLLIAPSVTPWRDRNKDGDNGLAHNPGVRKITFSEDGSELTDIEQYYLDLENSNSAGKANWKKLYSYQQAYGVAGITPKSLDKLAKVLKSDDAKFEKYYGYNSVGVSHDSADHCGCDCQNLHRCSFTHMDYTEFDQCIDDATCEGGKGGSKGDATTTGVCMALLACVMMANIVL